MSSEPPPSEAGRRAAGPLTGGWAGELLVACGFLALAVLLRLPVLLYSVTNFDESLYLLIGDELARGILPYTSLCDRKPFGLFALFALFALAPGDAIVASRIGASLAVGLTAYLLRRVAGLLFDEGGRGRPIGTTAGLAYILFTLANGGAATNTELFLNGLAALALLLALLAVRGRGPAEPPRLVPFLAAGLALGLGVQIKQSILFDMLAFLAGFFLLTTPGAAALGPRLRVTWRHLAALAAAAVLPTLAVLLLYLASGHLGDWATANLAQRGFVDDPNQKLEWDPAFRAMMEQVPMWVGALLATVLAPRLVRGRDREGRAVLFLLVWVGAVLVLQLFLRIAADHYFLQFLPPFCLLTGLLVGRGLLARVPERGVRAGLLAALVVLALFGVAKNQLVNAAYVLRDRHLRGETWAADTPRRVAADLEPLLAPGEPIYQVGFLPIVYYLTGAAIPTRFGFTGLPHRRYAGRDGCPWVAQEVELQRVLDTRPRFIVIEDGTFYEQLDPPVKAILDQRLARDYRLRKRYDMHWIHRPYPFERFVLNAAAAAELWELKDPAPAAAAGTP